MSFNFVIILIEMSDPAQTPVDISCVLPELQDPIPQSNAPEALNTKCSPSALSVFPCYATEASPPGCTYDMNSIIMAPALIKSLECSVCMKLVMQPRQHKCGNIFCNNCLETWCNSDDNRHKCTPCPLCREPLPFNLVPLAVPLQQIISSFYAKCNNCLFYNKIDSVLHHVNTHTCISCPMKCGFHQLTKQGFEKHMQKCNHQLFVSCKYRCGYAGLTKEVALHQESCFVKQYGERNIVLQLNLRAPLSEVVHLGMQIPIEYHNGKTKNAKVITYMRNGLLVQPENEAILLKASLNQKDKSFDCMAHLNIHMNFRLDHYPYSIATTNMNVFA